MNQLERELGLWLSENPMKESTITWSMALTDDQNVHLGDISQDLDKRETMIKFTIILNRFEVDRVKCGHWKPIWMGI